MRALFASLALALALALPAQAGELSPPSTVTVCLVPLGKHDAKLLPVATRGVEFLFGFTVKTLSPLPLPKEAYYAPRKRYRAEKLLDFLNAEVAPEAEACSILLGFTAVDISTTKEPYEDWGILGLGEVGGRAAVVSSFRAGKKTKSARVRAERTVKVVNHELGHVLGLPHVAEPGCLMQDAEGAVSTVDGESGLLCESTVTWIRENRRLDIPNPAAFDWEIVLGE